MNNENYADEVVLTTLNKPFYINLGLIAKYFENEEKLGEFLEGINNKYTSEELENIFTTLYKGYG